MENKKKETSIVKKMILAVAGGFIAGFLCLLLREVLNGSGNDGVWKVIDARSEERRVGKECAA